MELHEIRKELETLGTHKERFQFLNKKEIKETLFNNLLTSEEKNIAKLENVQFSYFSELSYSFKRLFDNKKLKDLIAKRETASFITFDRVTQEFKTKGVGILTDTNTASKTDLNFALNTEQGKFKVKQSAITGDFKFNEKIRFIAVTKEYNGNLFISQLLVEPVTEINKETQSEA